MEHEAERLYKGECAMKTAPKKAAAFFLAAVLVLGGIFLTRPKTKLDIDKFSGYLLTSPVYSGGMEELDRSGLAERYGGFSSSDVSGAKAFTGTDGTAREFAVIEAGSRQAADDIQNAMGRYCRDLMLAYQSKDPEEYERVRGFVIRRTRNYVILTISDPAGSGNRLVDSYFDQICYDKSA